MSILKVDTLQLVNGNAPTTKDLGFAAGSVIQVARGTLSALTSTTSTSYVASGLGVTITPKFSTSKLLISVDVGRPSLPDQNIQLDFKMYEGSSAIDSNRLGSLYHNTGTGSIYFGGTAFNLYLNATNTNARTYNLYYRASGGTVNLNDSTDVESSMTIMEVAQ